MYHTASCFNDNRHHVLMMDQIANIGFGSFRESGLSPRMVPAVHLPTLRRQCRILAVLRAHPGGLCAEVLLSAVCQPSDRVERKRWLTALYNLADGGRISVTGKAHRTAIASALIRATPESAAASRRRDVSVDRTRPGGGLLSFKQPTPDHGAGGIE